MPPGTDDLCVLADLKAWLNIQSSAEDAVLQNLITRGSLQMLRWMSRNHIIATSYTENRDGNDALIMLPRNFPLVTVSAVMVNGISIPGAADQVSPGYVFDARKIMLRGGCVSRLPAVTALSSRLAGGNSALPHRSDLFRRFAGQP